MLWKQTVTIARTIKGHALVTDKGDMKAPRNLGLIYKYGKNNIKPDKVKALEYLKKSMGLGDSTATVYYEDALLTGDGIA